MVRTKNNLTQWLTFFLVGVLETAQSSIDIFHKIILLREKMEKKKIITLGKRIPKAQELLQYLYRKPIVDMAEVAEKLNVNISTAHRLLKDFENLKILKEKTGYKRNRVFMFDEYLSLFR